MQAHCRQTLCFHDRFKRPSHDATVPSRGNCVTAVGHHSFALLRYGGGERDRTDDLLLAKQALSQLSYTPALTKLARGGVSDGQRPSREPHRAGYSTHRRGTALLAGASFGARPLSRYLAIPLTRRPLSAPLKVVGQGGFEPPTSRLSSARSNQLSY